MGEIGRDRREFLYDMSYCDILLIQRGYRRRNILQFQLQRIQAYGAMHCMSGSKKPPEEWLPLYFDEYRDIAESEPPISEEDANELLNLMQSINQKKDSQ